MTRPSGTRPARSGASWPVSWWGRTAPDRAAVMLGVASLISAVFTIPNGDPWQMVEMPAAAVAVALVLGVLACLGGLLGRALLVRAVGAAFGLSALVMLGELVFGTNWIGGDASTLSWWAGLGMGLLAAGLAPRDV